jgi:hypothetical protein
MSSLYNSGRNEEGPPPRTVRLLLFVFCPLLRNVPSYMLPSSGGPTVNYVISEMCLPNRYLAVVIFVTKLNQVKSF